MVELNLSSLAMPDFSLATLTPQEFLATIKPLSIFIVGMTIYALFVFKFYRFLAKRDILKMDKGETGGGFLGFLRFLARISSHTVQNLIFIPLLVFFWFAVLAALLLLLSKNHDPDTVLITALAIVASVRITSYYSENLSQDLAKMIPFALLGVFLVDISYFSLERSVEQALLLPTYWSQLLYYLVFVIAIELIMRTILFLFRLGSENSANGGS